MEKSENEYPQIPESPQIPNPSIDPIESSTEAAAAAASPESDRAPNLDRKEIFKALEVVERDSVDIAASYASLFSLLRHALSEVTSTSVENMQCFSDIVGSMQESVLDAATKGNRYINSCLRLNEELKGVESLALQLKMLRKNVDSLDLAVNRLLRFP